MYRLHLGENLSCKLAIENINVNVLSDLSIDAMDVSGEQQVWTYTCILTLLAVK